MGGARCSYRNCTQKSDQVTHMFHFPVFDKVRCHQWITNAQKLNFLDLKLSQLKNRLICQHHFTDDSFMNSLKNKLKSTAVPTLNGPYCSPSNDEIGNKGESDKDKELPINIEDIENDFLPRMEKNNHMSVKYGDFLTNDVSDNITLGPKNKSTSIVVEDMGIIFNRFSVPRNLAKRNLVTSKAAKERRQRLAAHSKIDLPQLVPDQELTPVFYQDPNLIQQEKSDKPENVIQTLQTDVKQTSLHTEPKQDLPALQKKPISSTIPLTKRVKIISEKSISEPLKLCKGEFQPVSPSIVINVPRKKERDNVEINGQKIKTIFMDNVSQSQFSEQINNNSGEGLSQVRDPYVLNTDVQMEIFSHKMPNTKSEVSGGKVEEPIENLELDLKDSQMKQEGEMLTSNQHVLPPESSEWTMVNLTGQPGLPYIGLPQVSSVDNTSYIHSMSEANTGLQNTCVPYTEELPPKSSLFKHAQHSTVQATATSEMPRNIVNSDREKQIATKMTPTKSIKNIIPPEKLAEIEEKRKYNMKLRDIIDSCLNNIDEEPEAVKLNAIKKKEMNNKKVGEHLANVSKQDNNIAYFEARLQRLEDTLLNKIELNSQKITDLKRSLKVNTTKKAVSTQTYQTAEATKRSLYQQISQYLSPDANSLIYEELFINSCVSKSTGSPKKRRKRI